MKQQSTCIGRHWNSFRCCDKINWTIFINMHNQWCWAKATAEIAKKFSFGSILIKLWYTLNGTVTPFTISKLNSTAVVNRQLQNSIRLVEQSCMCLCGLIYSKCWINWLCQTDFSSVFSQQAIKYTQIKYFCSSIKRTNTSNTDYIESIARWSPATSTPRISVKIN
jgi:hypothetical protein